MMSEPDYRSISFLSGNKSSQECYQRSPRGKRKKKLPDLRNNERKDLNWKGNWLLPSYVLDVKDPTTLRYREGDEEVEILSKEYDQDPKDLSTSHKRTEEIKLVKRCEETQTDSENVSLFVNNEIENLVESVIDVLQEVDPKKVGEMMEIARNPSALRKILTKPDIQHFIETLCDKPLVCNSKLFQVNNARLYSTLRHDNSAKELAYANDTEELPTEVTCNCLHELEMAVVNLEVVDTSLMSSLERLMGKIRTNAFKETSENKTCSCKCPCKNDSWKNLNSNDLLTSPTKRSKSSLPNAARQLKPETQMSRDSRAALNTLGSASGSLKGRTTLVTLAYDLTPKPTTMHTRQVIRDDLDKDFTKSKVTKPYCSMRRATCPACIERWRLPERKPKQMDDIFTTRSKIMRTSQKFLSTKEIQDILNLVTAFENADDEEENVTSLVSLCPPPPVASREASTSKDEQDAVVKTILRKMSNSQRIQVGRKAASMKTRQINLEGSEGRTRIPLSTFVNSVLSKNSILALATGNREKEILLTNSNVGFDGLVEIERKISIAQRTSLSKSRDLQQKLLESRAETDGTATADVMRANFIKMKCEIADREAEKKLAKFLNSPNP